MGIFQVGKFTAETLDEFIKEHKDADIITITVREVGADYNMLDYKLYPQKDLERFHVWRVTGGYKFLGCRNDPPALENVIQFETFHYRGRRLSEILTVRYSL